MGKCVAKLPHDCGTSDALQVFENGDGKYSGFCFRCDTYVPDPFNGEKPDLSSIPEVDVEAMMKEVEELPSVAIPSRGLKKKTVEQFGVKVALSEVDGTTPTVAYFPVTRKGELTGYKAKTLVGKKAMWSVGDVRGNVDLFNWKMASQCNNKVLFITEGELDAMSIWQAITDKQRGTKYQSLSPSVTSIVKGAQGAVKEISSSARDIKMRFNNIVLVFDMDDPGQKAVNNVLKVWPNAETVTLPFKDANECLTEGRPEDLANICMFERQKPNPSTLVISSSLHEAARQATPLGFSYPWPKLTQLLRGARLGETQYWAGGVKMGKSTIRCQLAEHFISVEGKKVFMAAPEEPNEMTHKMMVGKAANRIFTDPNIEFDYEAYDKHSMRIGEMLYLIDRYQNVDWETVKDYIREAVVKGCEIIMLDPITNFTNGMSASDANTVLQQIAQDTAAMALEMNFLAIMFCHLNKPEFGPPHEYGGKVMSSQFAGSRAMMRSCDLAVGIEGNKDPHDEDADPSRRDLIILEDRAFGQSDSVAIRYNKYTGKYGEI